MNLLDGLNYYKQCSDSDWNRVARRDSVAGFWQNATDAGSRVA